MKNVFWCFLSFLALRYVHCQVTTTRSSECPKSGLDGVIEYNCWEYTECINNVIYKHRCPSGQVLDNNFQCVPDFTIHRYCEPVSGVTCDQVPDGMYAVKDDHCTTYTRCYQELKVGLFLCPATLVFNEDIQACDYPFNVLPPCGTAEPTTVATKRDNSGVQAPLP